MQINNIIFKELVKRGYSRRGKIRVWDVSDSKLWYLTPALAKGFLNLKKYNPYRIRVIKDEIELIKKYSGRIVEKFGKKKFNLIDLGSGSGIKAAQFIKNMPRNVKVRYCPVDISSYYINKTSERIRSLNSQKVASIKTFIVDFRELDEVIGLLRNGEYQNNFCLLFGETISHYDIHDILFKLSEKMFSGDTLIIGNGIRKGKRFVHLEKYKDHLFNDWFIHVMNALGFKDNEVKIDVRFTNRLECFYHILVNKKINYEGNKVSFKKGDEVIVAIQYKFFERELKKYCKMYFSQVKIFKTKNEEYCLIVCKK